MKLYVAICIDRHIDEYVRVFSTEEKAKQCCHNFVDERYDLDEQILTTDMRRDGWIYFALYGYEGDSVRVEARELDVD